MSTLPAASAPPAPPPPPTFKHLELALEAAAAPASGLIACVRLNRPEVRNAFDDEVIAELSQAFTYLGAQTEVRAIVLAAQGKAFCAGADLNWMKRMASYTHAENLADAAQLADMLGILYACPKPTIAQVQGDVYAGGLGLVSACDIAIGADNAHFCVSEVKMGLIPATISPYVIRAMGARAAHRYFLTAERFDAQEARRLGLLHEVVPAADLASKVNEVAQALAQASPQAVRAAKQLVQTVAGQAISPELVRATVQGIADIRVSEQGQEGVAAFLQKRPPAWLGAPRV